MNSCLYFQRIVESHATIVVRSKQDDQLSQVANVGPVIMVEIGERQVNDVVHDVS